MGSMALVDDSATMKRISVIIFDDVEYREWGRSASEPLATFNRMGVLHALVALHDGREYDIR